MNKVIVIGNLGRDPEMKYTPSGSNVTTFSIASNRRYKTADGEQHDETTWFSVSAWGRLGETCHQYLEKGQQIYLEGRLTARTWETQDGEKRFSMDLTATEMQMLGRSGNGNGQGRANQGDEEAYDDLPF